MCGYNESSATATTNEEKPDEKSEEEKINEAVGFLEEDPKQKM